MCKQDGQHHEPYFRFAPPHIQEPFENLRNHNQFKFIIGSLEQDKSLIIVKFLYLQDFDYVVPASYHACLDSVAASSRFDSH